LYNKERDMATAPLRDSNLDPLDGWSLPERIFRPSWQIVCHLNDIPRPATSTPSTSCGESLIRGARQGRRGAGLRQCLPPSRRATAGRPVGRCGGRIVCPYHAWTYDLDGRLIGVPMRDDYPALDMDKQGSFPRSRLEIWRGFVFVRLEDDRRPVGREP
jgi:phenylpropionate dioxygenase-like ring-hydroxylating dioxygenase large terminal subunit